MCACHSDADELSCCIVCSSEDVADQPASTCNEYASVLGATRITVTEDQICEEVHVFDTCLVKSVFEL